MTKDFLTFLDFTQADLIALLDLADTLRDAWQAKRLPQNLAGKSIALIWDAEGFRNRVSFELGIAAMGGIAVQVPGNLDERESIQDVARYLDNWFDGIVSRARWHSHMLRLAAASQHPVINARTDFNHPCEILGDLAYIRAKRGSLDSLKVVFVGEDTNLCHSWFEAAVRLPIHVVQICPVGYQVSANFIDRIQRDAVGTMAVGQDLDAGLKAADVVYTDCWPHRSRREDHEYIAQQFLPYQITAEKLRLAAPGVFFLPCPPVTRGEEVSEDAMAYLGHQVYEAKDYLLHAQNAVLTALL
ncbi:MAG: ornithine carbamoyltransferase [Anaerolineae bacterium]|nr:ornithine carbamoyltransferase [Anaerolineae bacterium]